MPHSHPFNFLLWSGLPLAAMIVLLVFDTPRLDFALAHLFFDPQRGFIGHDSAFLEDVLHDRAKQAVILLGMLALGGFVASLLSARLRRWRRPLGYVVLSLGLSTAIVTPLKAVTAVQCPWSLAEFGGVEPYSPLLGPHVYAEKPGRCWPGGHASAGFCLLALFFALRDGNPRMARVALVGALVLGSVFSLGRMMQGAHFLSHNVWTLLFDWMISLACYRLVLYRPAALSALTYPAEGR
ncbi:phosphatase PAP2 family protein [Pseudomonas jinjuensis]|uniref:Membrane-associated enzyme, PAP2 (Acid phosphatase) superfamily n=1 Tax=Pseudomonas jinjuensis TaxID=198616 RepID=A0A1H0LJC4_9PSED|nr:phosphatase PAP2 family protein [Pseudomonas jinjuensis]SDO68126.1 Membrane-associated enzyme, PAP2 (acid phosphatase) superfamily [Pseudomonas jinjuensis]